MNDFVLETRPRSSRLSPMGNPTGFVAELRPSSRRRVAVESSKEYPLNSEITNLKPYDYPSKIPNDNFEYPNKNHNDNFETDLNDLLQNKSFSKEKITNVLHNSVVKLINTLLKGHWVTDIQGSINISLAESQEKISVDINEDYNPMKRGKDICNSLNGLGEGLRFKGEPKRCNIINATSCHEALSYNRDFNYVRENSPENVYYSGESACPDSCYDATVAEEPNYSLMRKSEFENEDLSNSPQKICKNSEGSDKSDNEEESGYSSSERESICSPPRKTSIESIESSEISQIEDNEHEEPALVIDLSLPYVNNVKDMEECSLKTAQVEDASAVDYDEYIDVNQTNGCDGQIMPGHKTSNGKQTVKSESEDAKRSRFDVITDVPMDLSGDTQASKEEDSKTLSMNKTVPLPCKKCQATFRDSTEYGKHMLECHKLHACPTCRKDFSSKNNLKRHVRIHTGARPYKCEQCEMSFARKDDLKGHTLTHNFSKPFRCSLCKKGYTDRACVKNHMSKEHCSRLMRICPQCGESFDHEEAFLEHKKTHPSLKQFACDTCPFIGTNHLMALKHKLLHSHKLFSCKPCNAYFADPFDYTKHVRKHKKSKDYSFYICCFCNCTLPTYEQFVRHEYSHAQGKFHECSVCKKQFKSKASMREHALVHSNSTTLTQQPPIPHDNKVQMESKMESISSDTSLDCLQEKSHDSCIPQTSLQATTTSTKALPKDIGKTFDPKMFNSTAEVRSPESASVPRVEIRNDFGGELLDLRMKFDGNDSSAKDQKLIASQTEQNTVADSSNQLTSSMSTICVPRNGYAAIDTRIVEREASPHGDCFVNGKNSSSSSQEEFQIVWQSPSFPVTDDKKKPAFASENLQNVNSVNGGQFLPREKSLASLQADGQKTVGKNYSSRYKPYSKMVDLANKFIAARGSLLRQNLLKDIGNTPSGLLHRKNETLPSTTQHRGTSVTEVFQQIDSEGESFSERSENIGEERACNEEIFPASPNMMIGLTGKSYLVSTGKTSPIMKSDVVDDRFQFNHQQSPNSPPGQNIISQKLSSMYPNPNLGPDSPLDMNKTVTSNSCNTNTTATSTNNHMQKKNSDTASHECDICNAKFESFFQLESHSVVNHNRYLCEFCRKGFTARPNRDRHVRYHTGERPYKCELCPSAFFRGDDLKYHRTTRHPMEQISCNRCTASFTWQRDLDRHLRHSKCVATA